MAVYDSILKITHCDVGSLLKDLYYYSVFDGIWAAKSSCRYICILTGFVQINTMDALEQMVCGLHLLLLLRVRRRKRLKRS